MFLQEERSCRRGRNHFMLLEPDKNTAESHATCMHWHNSNAKPLLHQESGRNRHRVHKDGLDGSLLVSHGEEQVEGQGSRSRRTTRPGLPVSTGSVAPVLEQVRTAELWLGGGSAIVGQMELRRKSAGCFAGIRREGPAAPPPEQHRNGIGDLGKNPRREERASAWLLWKRWRFGDGMVGWIW
jgi:hypothetical protein